jgi:hypothetical protein
VGAVHKKGATDGVGDFGGGFFLPGIHPRGADAAGEVGPVRAEKFEEGGKISWIVLPVAVHHGGVGSGGGEQSCVESRALAEVFWKVENANSSFLIEKRAGAIAATVVDRDNFHARNGGPSFVKNGGDIFLLVIKWDDERKIGGHGRLLRGKERGKPSERIRKEARAYFYPELVESTGEEPSVAD